MPEEISAEIILNEIEAQIAQNVIAVEVIVGGAGGAGIWGGIGGNIIDQLDLIALLGDYALTADLNIINWDNAFSWGNHALAGYLTSYTETDPVYTGSSWYTTTNNSTDWNTAYGWGNHASAGYLTAETNTGAVILAPATGVRNTIISQTATSVGLIIKNHASQSVPNFILQRSNGITTTHFKLGGQLQINADPNSAPVSSDDTYIASLQNTNSVYSFLEILNNGGSGKGCFFGLEGDDFNQYNWQGGGIGLFTAPTASDGFLRLRLENNGNIGLYSPGKWAWSSGWGGGVGVVAIGNATTAPTTSLTNCLALYSVSQELYFMSSSNIARKVATLNATETFTNKRITYRIGTTASSATPTPNADTTDQYNVTALAVNATFGSPTGTPTDGQDLKIRIKDNGIARTLAFNAIYRAIGVTLPTTTVISKTMYLSAKYNTADSKWDVLAVGIEA